MNKINAELEIFKDNVNIHDLPKAFYYIAGKYLKKQLIENIGISVFDDLVIKYYNLIRNEKNENDIKLLSLGSGNCDLEINLIKKGNFKGKFYCYELNPYMLERGRKLANENGLKNIEFIQADINKIKLQNNFDIIFANHSLHHFVELEHIFNAVNNCMTEKSFFIINDMIGRNGHMFWDNTFLFCNALWNIFPKELKYNHVLKKYFEERIQWDCSLEGFEGIRAQDILPLLDKYFKFKDFAPFFSIIHHLVNREFGHCYNLDNELHIELLNMIGHYDHFMLINKILKPCQLIATVVKKNVEVFDYKYMYFKDPREIYEQNDHNIWNYFDSFNNLKSDLQNSNVIIDNLKADLNKLKSSRSWKITAPLRKINKILKIH